MGPSPEVQHHEVGEGPEFRNWEVEGEWGRPQKRARLVPVEAEKILKALFSVAHPHHRFPTLPSPP